MNNDEIVLHGTIAIIERRLLRAIPETQEECSIAIREAIFKLGIPLNKFFQNKFKNLKS